MARKPFHIPEIIREEVFLELLNSVEDPKRKIAYALGFYQAMRVSEVAKLQPEDYDPKTKLIHIKQAKGHKDRKIPAAPEVIKGLKHLPIGVSIRTIQRWWEEDSKKYLGKKYKYHSLRHASLSHYINRKKWNIRHAQIFAGHSDIGITQIYTHVDPTDLTRVMWGEERDEQHG